MVGIALQSSKPDQSYHSAETHQIVPDHTFLPCWQEYHDTIARFSVKIQGTLAWRSCLSRKAVLPIGLFRCLLDHDFTSKQETSSSQSLAQPQPSFKYRIRCTASDNFTICCYLRNWKWTWHLNLKLTKWRCSISRLSGWHCRWRRNLELLHLAMMSTLVLWDAT